MINASLNRIRNEDILHLQRARKTWQPWTSGAGLSNNRISAPRQLEFKSAEAPVSVTRDAIDRFMAKGRKRLCENPTELFVKVKFE